MMSSYLDNKKSDNFTIFASRMIQKGPIFIVHTL